MVYPHDPDLADRLPSLSHHLRWRNGGWVRTSVAPTTPVVDDVAEVASADVPVPAVATAGPVPTTPTWQQRLPSPREHLATLLRALARRLEYAGSAR